MVIHRGSPFGARYAICDQSPKCQLHQREKCRRPFECLLRTPGSSRCVINFTERSPSGTRRSLIPASLSREKACTIRCFSLRLSELRRGAEKTSNQ